MESKKIKICKFLNCDKEVYTPQALFCGEHERTYRNRWETKEINLLFLHFKIV